MILNKVAFVQYVNREKKIANLTFDDIERFKRVYLFYFTR